MQAEVTGEGFREDQLTAIEAGLTAMSEPDARIGRWVESPETQMNTTGGVMVGERPGHDSSDAICSSLTDIISIIWHCRCGVAARHRIVTVTFSSTLLPAIASAVC